MLIHLHRYKVTSRFPRNNGVAVAPRPIQPVAPNIHKLKEFLQHPWPPDAEISMVHAVVFRGSTIPMADLPEEDV
jgi:hypothetical protein